MNLNPQYFSPRQHHVCMFCSTDLVSIGKDGRFISLGNKVHVLLEKTHPGLYVINCCSKCSKALDFTSQSLLDSIHENVVESKELALRATGVSEDTVQAQKQTWNNDKPVVGWYAIEQDVKSRQKLVERYKRHLEAKQAKEAQ